MDFEDIRVGMKVRIAKSCHITSENHGFNGSMRELQGTVATIRKIIDKRSVSIGGWQWSIKDISPELPFGRSIIKHPKPQTFDPKLLDI